MHWRRTSGSSSTTPPETRPVAVSESPQILCLRSLWTGADNLGTSSDGADPPIRPYPCRLDKRSPSAIAVWSDTRGRRPLWQTFAPFPTMLSDSLRPSGHTTGWVCSSQVDSPIAQFVSPVCCATAAPGLELVGWQGFEPWTNGLKGRCSTAELPARKWERTLINPHRPRKSF